MRAQILTGLCDFKQNRGMSPEPRLADPVYGTGGPSVALGIDVGSTNTKAALVAVEADEVVRELSVRSFPTPRDADALLGELEAAIRGVLAETGLQPAVVGVASMAESGVPLGARSEPLCDFIRWDGQDGTLGADCLRSRADARSLFLATGVPLLAKTPLAMWAALRETEPALWTRMARWAGAADWVALALTGTLVTDHTLAGRTMGYRLPPSGEALPRSFDMELLGLVGLRAAQLPRVLRPGQSAGAILGGAARRFGLPAGIPVLVAGHDHAVGAWAAGVRSPGDVADSVGTAEALVRVTDGRIDREAAADAGMSVTRTIAGDRESLLAGTAHAGSLVAAWFSSTLSRADRDDVLAQVAALGAGPDDVLVLPYPSGRQTPAPDPDARLRILDGRGQPIELSSRSARRLTRGLLVGLNLHLRWMGCEQGRLAGAPIPETIAVLGGAALGGAGGGSNPWLSLKAAIMPAALELVDSAEPVASGAALLAATRSGMVSARVTLPRSRVPLPAGVPARGAGYDAAYASFVAAATEARVPEAKVAGGRS
jgi:xylulokinase